VTARKCFAVLYRVILTKTGALYLAKIPVYRRTVRGVRETADDIAIAIQQVKAPQRGASRRRLPAGPQSASFPSEMWTDRLRSRKTILVVADDPLIRRLLCRTLRPAYHILQAANAEDAVRIAAQHRRDIDLLLTEVKLPRMCGWELLGLLALDYPKLHVIYVTKSIDPEMRAHIRRQKVVLLEQPFPSACLQQTVRDLLEDPPSMRAGVERPVPSLLLRMRSYLRRHWWIHRAAS